MPSSLSPHPHQSEDIPSSSFFLHRCTQTDPRTLKIQHSDFVCGCVLQHKEGEGGAGRGKRPTPFCLWAGGGREKKADTFLLAFLSTSITAFTVTTAAATVTAAAGAFQACVSAMQPNSAANDLLQKTICILKQHNLEQHFGGTIQSNWWLCHRHPQKCRRGLAAPTATGLRLCSVSF